MPCKLCHRMSSEFLSAIKNVYEYSGVPTAVTDESFRVIWKNKVSGSVFSEGSCLRDLFGEKLPSPGLMNTVSRGRIYSFNILKAEDRAEQAVYYVAEMVRSEKMSEILSMPAIKDYICFLCSRIRESAGIVTTSADEIYDAVSCGLFDGEMITDRLNVIDGGIMSITKEIIDPDQFYSLMDMEEKEVTMSAENELQRAVNEASAVLGRSVRVTCDCDKDIYFRMDRTVFETVIAGMAVRCCRYGKVPEMLVFSAGRIADTRAEISVMSVYLGGTSGKKRSGDAARSDIQTPNKDIFFSYLCDILCAKHGAVFTGSEMPDGYICKMEFDVISKGAPGIAMAEAGYAMEKGRFGIMSLKLSGITELKRYAFYDIDSYSEDKNGGGASVFAENKI